MEAESLLYHDDCFRSSGRSDLSHPFILLIQFKTFSTADTIERKCFRLHVKELQEGHACNACIVRLNVSLLDLTIFNHESISFTSDTSKNC